MLGENPPTVGNSSPFANFNATLYVPKGCATKYWAAPIWGDLKYSRRIIIRSNF